MLLRQELNRIQAQFQTFLQRNKWVVIGMLGVVLAFIGGAGLNAVSTPWLFVPDSPFHFDHAWRVYQGEWPQFHDELEIPGFSEDTRFHRTTKHPPLYYVILAPFVGPFIASGNWEMAVAVGRMVTIGIAILSLLALAWAGWVIGGRYRRTLAVAAPAVGGTLVPFVEYTSAIFSDGLLVLMTTVAFTLAALVIYKGPRKSYLIWLALVLLLGMAVRVAFVGMFGLALVAVVASFMIHGRGKLTQNITKGIAYAGLMGLVTVIGIGWFYYFHNFKASGSLITAWPEGMEHARRYKPFLEVITSRHLWYLVLLQLFGWSQHYIVKFTVNQWISYIVFLLGISGSIVWFLKEKIWRLFNKANTAAICVGAMLVAYGGIVFAQQVVYATGYGMYNTRYILPAWVVAGIILAFGLLMWQLRGLVVTAVVTVAWMAVINWIVYTLTAKTALPENLDWYHLLQAGAMQNGFPSIIVPVLLLTIATGVVFTGTALWQLTLPAKVESDPG